MYRPGMMAAALGVVATLPAHSGPEGWAKGSFGFRRSHPSE